MSIQAEVRSGGVTETRVDDDVMSEDGSDIGD
jgi:hypothetical protein